MCLSAIRRLHTHKKKPHLARHQLDIARGQSNGGVGHHLCLDGAQASGGAGLDEAVQHHVQQVCDLAMAEVDTQRSTAQSVMGGGGWHILRADTAETHRGIRTPHNPKHSLQYDQ